MWTPNRLTIRPHEIETTGGYGSLELWELSVDGRVRWPDAKPFRASDQSIVPAECHECGMCGAPSVSVRQTEDSVLWFGNEFDYGADLPNGEILVFDPAEYSSLLSAEEGVLLPEVTADEARNLLSTQRLPERSSLLYVESEFSDEDCLRVIHLICRAHDAEQLVLEGTPRATTKLNVGADVEGDIVEFTWEIGCEGHDVRVRFWESPRLPVWYGVESEDLRELIAESGWNNR